MPVYKSGWYIQNVSRNGPVYIKPDNDVYPTAREMDVPGAAYVFHSRPGEDPANSAIRTGTRPSVFMLS